MRIENLPSPGQLGQGLQLRTVAAKAISYCETVAAITPGGKVSSANQLSAFFAACKTAVDAVADTVAPTITARQVRATAPTVIELTFSEPLDATIVPSIAAFAAAGVAKTISAIRVSENKVFLTVTAAYVVGNFPTATIAYTAPGTNALRDVAGNLLATSAATAMAWVA